MRWCLLSEERHVIRHVSGIAEIVDDIDAAAQFYREVLGLPVDHQPGGGYSVVKVPGVLHFGLWSRAAAAEATFGDKSAVERIPLGFAIEFEWTRSVGGGGHRRARLADRPGTQDRAVGPGLEPVLPTQRNARRHHRDAVGPPPQPRAAGRGRGRNDRLNETGEGPALERVRECRTLAALRDRLLTRLTLEELRMSN